MRKLVLFLLMTISIAAWAQEREYHPFCEEGKEWLVRYYIESNQSIEDYIYRLEGYQDIDDHRCMLMKEYYNNEERVVAAVYEEAGKVYFYELNGFYPEERQVLYDFNVKEGDRTQLLGGEWFWTIVEFTDVHEQEFEGLMRNVFKFNFVTSGIWESYIDEVLEPEKYVDMCVEPLWIEGIGSIKGPLYPVVSDPLILGSHFKKLMLCRIGDRILYDPEGVAAMHPIHVATPVAATYDLSGRRVTTPTDHGIFIEDGKRVVR